MENLFDPNVGILELAAQKLEPLLSEIVFVGGSAIGLLITDVAASPIRATVDVDVIIQVASLNEYQKLSKRLRACGFKEDTREDAPACRWLSESLILDIMPTNKEILGFGNDWYEPAIKHAQNAILPSGKKIKLITAPYFLMTKLEAFEGRGKGDFQMSHDIEDIIVVIDGRAELIEEMMLCDEKLRKALSNKFTHLLSNKRFLESIFGHMSPDEVSQKRVTKVIDSIRNIAVHN